MRGWNVKRRDEVGERLAALRSALSQGRPPLALSVDDAAESLGMSRPRLMRLVRAGGVLTHWLGHQRRIPASEISRLRAHNTRRGHD